MIKLCDDPPEQPEGVSAPQYVDSRAVGVGSVDFEVLLDEGSVAYIKLVSALPYSFPEDEKYANNYDVDEDEPVEAAPRNESPTALHLRHSLVFNYRTKLPNLRLFILFNILNQGLCFVFALFSNTG